MDSIVFIRPESFEVSDLLQASMDSKGIKGNNYILYVPTNLELKAREVAISLSICRSSQISQNFQLETSSLIENSAIVFDRISRFISEASALEKVPIIVENIYQIKHYVNKNLGLDFPDQEKFLAIVYFKKNSKWNQTLIKEEEFSFEEEHKIKEYSNFIILTTNGYTKNKISEFELITSNFIEGKNIVTKCTNELEICEANKIISRLKAEDETMKKTVNDIRDTVHQLSKDLDELNQVVDSQSSESFSNDRFLDFNKYVKPVINYSPDAVVLKEEQSINRTNHVFTILNNMNYNLKHLKLCIKENKKCLSEFSLGPKETKILEIKHEYDLLMQHGTLKCQLISCSFIMSNLITISLLDVSISAYEPHLTLRISNRFTTQSNCELRINKKAYKKITKIMHFDFVNIDIVGMSSDINLIEVYSEKGILISNTLEN
jgi:hypothetical protein